MAKVKFKATPVENFQCEPGKSQSFLWDAGAPGLALRATASGAKSYIFETRLHGKTLRITIGDQRTWAITAARAEATRYKAMTNQGIDPRQQKVEQRIQAEAARAESMRQDLTLGAVWPKYLNVRKAKAGWSEGHYQNHVNLAAIGGQKKRRGPGLTVSGPLAPLMAVRLSDLTADKVADWLESAAKDRPTNAAQSYRILRAFMRWCADIAEYRNIIPEDAYAARNVRDVLPKSQTKEGDSLQREQLPAWFDAVRKIRNPVIGAYLQALLLTGARREELAGLKWADVDFQWRSLAIRDKVEGTRVIPLTPYVAEILSALPHRNEWVFSSLTAQSGRLTEPRIAHTKALAAAGLPHVSLHGLRRSFGTLCEWVEVPSGISAQIMGHKPSALAEKHYRRRPLDLLRKWHDTIEAWILEQAGIEFQPAALGLRVVSSS